ncbi:MAG: tetratricopeptide repeat protein [Proteiniphilum sp.]|jgi:tetratricopeptide (TPR) repeat protein|nr:tetratricopeptide repeat protein [Proteiniphilum sp.]
MEDNELNIDLLIEKYEQMHMLGRKIYFDADEFAALAEYYNAEGDTHEAEKLIREGLEMHPGSSELMLLKARMLVYSEMYREALDYMKGIPESEEVDLSLLKIEAMLHLGNRTDADRLINDMLDRELPPDDSYFFITELGFMLNDMDFYNRAIPLLEESMSFNNSNSEVIVDLAYAYEKKGDLDKAIEYSNLLLDIDPYSFEGWANAGKLYSMNGQHDKAIDAFDFALTINGDDLTVLKMKALSLCLNDNLEASIALFEECLQKTPDDEGIYESLLEAYMVLEQYDRMMALIDRKEEALGSEGITIKRAFVYFYKEDYEQARELFSMIPEYERDTLDYFMLEGEMAFLDEDFAVAEKAYMKAALLSKDNEDVLDRLANTSVAQGKYEQAAGYLEVLLKLDPDFPTAKSRLAFIRFEIGSKEPFDEIMEEFSDQELIDLLNLIIGTKDKDSDPSEHSREKILIRLNEARENRVLFKNIKY